MDLRFALLLVCFFVSGFAALLYQTAWTREFAFLFGTSELAVVAVLAAYMGGLAGGAAIAARFVKRLTRPILAYGLLELGIAIGALCVPFLIQFVQTIYLAVAGGLDAPPETMSLTTALFHLIGAFFVLAPCTLLMGATLPLLARYAVSEDRQVGPRIGLLYATNAFGAIVGTLVAAFILLPEFGLRQTVYIGVAANALVFLAAAALARRVSAEEAARGLQTKSTPPLGRGKFHWILPAMTISGAVSFLYEVLWTRLLGQVLGGSTAAFASMLSSFLLGIALGSAIASRFAKTRRQAAVGFVLSQFGIGILAWGAFRAADLLPDLARAVGASPSAPAAGAAAAGIILLPVTLCIGATFPFAVRLLARDAQEAASVSGRVYAWNTVGSIIGAILAGFVLLPELGLAETATVGVVTSLSLAGVAAVLMQPRRVGLAGLAAATLILAGLVGLPTPTDLLLHSAITGHRTPGNLYYLGVGRSATVTVVETLHGWKLLTNGLPESGVDREEVPDRFFKETAWLSLLPTAARPETDQMLIIGLGGANTLAATASSVSAIDVIELEEEVVVANRLIPRAHSPLDDPRVSIRLGDARGAMNLSHKRYDAIVSQPSHPWTSGASHLYTREFFELTHSKLKPGGIFVQWIGASFVDVQLFGSLMASMTDAFRYVHVYRPVPMALVFMASDEPIDLQQTVPRALAANRADFARYGIHQIEDFFASWALDTEGVRALTKNRPPNTDDHNLLATTRLPPSDSDHRKQLDRALSSIGVLKPAVMRGIRPVRMIRRMVWNSDVAHAQRLIAGLPKAVAKSARGWIALDRGRIHRAETYFRSALKIDPNEATARAGLVAIIGIDGIDVDRLDEVQGIVFRANRLVAKQDWSGLKDMDVALSKAEAGSLLFGSAVRARVQWRLSIGDESDGRKAIEIIDTLLTRQRTAIHFLLRASAGALASDTKVAWAALEEALRPGRVTEPVRSSAVVLARRLGEPPKQSVLFKRLNTARHHNNQSPPARPVAETGT
ncbi:MAG: fused MFS/spermidine synthase [Myxococcota bacterium]